MELNYVLENRQKSQYFCDEGSFQNFYWDLSSDFEGFIEYFRKKNSRNVLEIFFKKSFLETFK